jgi:hypothetical protein
MKGGSCFTGQSPRGVQVRVTDAAGLDLNHDLAARRRQAFPPPSLEGSGEIGDDGGYHGCHGGIAFQ